MKILNLILSFTFLQQSLQIGSKCNQLLNQDALYSLEALSDSDDFVYNITKTKSINFRFCQFTKTKCLKGPKQLETYSILFDENACTRLTGDQKFTKQFRIYRYINFKSFNFELMDDNDPTVGIKLHIPGGEDGLSVDFNIQCNKEMEGEFEVEKVTFDEKNKLYTIVGSSPNGCPVLQLSQVWLFFDNHYIVVSIICIIMGFAECFFGRRLFQPTLFILGYLVAFMFILLFLSEFVIKPDTSPVIIWLILAIGVLFGVLMGFLAMVLPKAGATCAAIWLGIIVSFLLQDAFLYKFTNNNIVLYVVMGCLCLLFAILAWFYFDLMLILSTSLFGSYLIIRPIAYYIGSFPSELHISQLFYYKQIDTVPIQFYYYLIAILVLQLIGGCFQWRQKQQGQKTITLEDLQSINDGPKKEDNAAFGNYIELEEIQEQINFRTDSGKSSDSQKRKSNENKLTFAKQAFTNLQIDQIDESPIVIEKRGSIASDLNRSSAGERIIFEMEGSDQRDNPNPKKNLEERKKNEEQDNQFSD